jgi:hypothetical protein
MRNLTIAALAICCVVVAILVIRNGRDPEKAVAPIVEEPAREIAAPEVSSPSPPPVPVAPDAGTAPAVEEPAETIESVPSLPIDHPHALAAFGIARAREDDVDACRDHFTLPPLDQLLARSRVIAAPVAGQTRVQEADLHQLILFEISTSRDAYLLDSARVIESWLEFPAPDGSLRRTPVNDASLNRCVESALAGAQFRSGIGAEGETFQVKGFAGEAVYDLR